MSDIESSGLGLSQVAACLIVGYFVYRLFFKAGPAPDKRATAIDMRRIQEQTEIIRGMFPQISEAAVQAELLRNGGSVEIATERIITTGFLPEPPNPTPAATIPIPAAPAARPAAPIATSSRRPTPAASSSSSASKSQYPDLITRYNLQSRLHEASDEDSAQSSGKGKAPQSKADRQLAHQKKRDDMIIAARKRLEEMDRKKAAA
ncbi:hypothetical protein RUND412_001833 [Rhizina undulata]